MNWLVRPCSCFEKHICTYLYLPKTSSRSVSLQSTIVFPFWKKLWKMGMKIKLCFNQGLFIPPGGVPTENLYGWNGAKAETKLDHRDCQGEPWRDFSVPWCWGGGGVLSAPWGSFCNSGLREEVKASSHKPCHKLLPPSCLCEVVEQYYLRNSVERLGLCPAKEFKLT